MPQTVGKIYFSFIVLKGQSSLLRMLLQNFANHPESILQINKGCPSGPLKVTFPILPCKWFQNVFFYLGRRLLQPPEGYQQCLWVTGSALGVRASHFQFALQSISLSVGEARGFQRLPEASRGHSAVLETLSGHCSAWLVFVLTANFYGSSFPCDSSQEIREKWRTLFTCYHVPCTWF